MQNGFAIAALCPVSVKSDGSKSDFYFEEITENIWYYTLNMDMKELSMKFNVNWKHLGEH